MGAIDALRRGFGLRSPEDVLVAGYDNIAPAAWPPYRLTTVDIRLDAVTEAALSLVEPRAGQAAEALIRPRFVERASNSGSLDVM